MSATVALIDYGSGNLRSAAKALERMAAERGTGQSIVVTADPTSVASAERIVLPGVGAFRDCMIGLSGIPGMVETLTGAAMRRAVPFLGICVGMQLLAPVGREHGDHNGLGWIDGEVVKLAPSDPALKIPHMGWNALHLERTHPLTEGMEGKEVYFVHSYRFAPTDAAAVLATTDYGGPFAAVVGKDNIVGTQFHPEKSQAVGLAFLGRFLAWAP